MMFRILELAVIVGLDGIYLRRSVGGVMGFLDVSTKKNLQDASFQVVIKRSKEGLDSEKESGNPFAVIILTLFPH